MTVCAHCGELVAPDDEHYDDDTREPWHWSCLAVFACRCGRTTRLVPVYDLEAVPCECGKEMRIR